MSESPASTGAGSPRWRIAAVLLGLTTIALALALTGRLVLDQTSGAPLGATAELPAAEALDPLVAAMGAQIESNYSDAVGWPAAVSVDAAGTARTSDGIVLGTVPPGCTLVYEKREPGGYSLTLSLPSGVSASTGREPAGNGESAGAPPAQVAGTLASLLRQSFAPPWPTELTVDSDGAVIGPDGVTLLTLPEGYSLTYTTLNDGADFEVTITLTDGTGSRYLSSTDRVEPVG